MKLSSSHFILQKIAVSTTILPAGNVVVRSIAAVLRLIFLFFFSIFLLLFCFYCLLFFYILVCGELLVTCWWKFSIFPPSARLQTVLPAGGFLQKGKKTTYGQWHADFSEPPQLPVLVFHTANSMQIQSKFYTNPKQKSAEKPTKQKPCSQRNRAFSPMQLQRRIV